MLPKAPNITLYYYFFFYLFGNYHYLVYILKQEYIDKERSVELLY